MSKVENEISSLRTTLSFLNARACSDTLFHVLNKAFDNPMKLEEQAAMTLAGGIKQHGYQCGMIWGATLAAGAQAYRLFGPGPKAETKAIIAAQKLVETFRFQNKEINCLEITDIDKSSSTLQMINYFLIKGGSIGCLRMASKYAKVAFNDINSSLSEKFVEVNSSTISCASLLSHKMGVSDMHAVIPAGFAGGIGLCGGACGALATAIWIIGVQIQNDKENASLWNDKDFNSKLEKLIERFLETTNYEFECSKIVGKKFESVQDHATYLCDGGCSKVIEVLATN